MDLWVVAAAAGVGYVAKYWQNLSGDKEGLTQSSFGSGYSLHGQLKSPNVQNQEWDQPYPFQVLARKWLEGDEFSEKEDVSRGRFQEIASSSGSNDNVLSNLGKYRDYNVPSLANLPPSENMDEINGKNEFLDNSDHLLHGFETRETSSFTRFRSLRRRRSNMYIVKPLNSLESCFIAQLHNKHGDVEDYVYNLHPSLSTPTTRPLLVTDGRQKISRVGTQSFDGGRDGLNKEEINTLLGYSSRHPIGLVEVLRKPNQKSGKERLTSFQNSVSGGSFDKQESPNGMLLFFIGITIGIMIAVVANKVKVDRLNGLLKQTGNLVQDLHDELDMKELLNVKELANEDYQFQGKIHRCSINWEYNESSFQSKLDESANYDRKRSVDEKAENSELMSKIEAELEAELERLELNMKADSLKRISAFVELGPDFEVDVVKGDLKLGVARKQHGDSSDSEHESSGTATTHMHNANYAVSPWELSLRLHELIESRLKARIQNLEWALQNSHKMVHSLESQHVVSQRSFAYSEVGSSYTRKSLSLIGEDGEIERQHLMINADNDVYGETIKMTEEIDEKSWGSNDDGESENEDEDEAYAKLLMEQTLEKSRSGSSVDLNSNHILYSVNDQSVSE